MQPSSNGSFRIALTGDFYGADGSLKFQDVGLDLLEQHPSVKYRAFAEHQAEISPMQLGDANGVIVLTPRVTEHTVSQSDQLVAIGRFGVGYDAVDVAACTAADVAVYITAGAVDRSVAEATVSWMLALVHQARIKDRLMREGRWDERSRYMGGELRNRTLGIIGLGGIGRATIQLLAGFGMNTPLAFDPYAKPEQAAEVGAQLVSLETLLSEADFVSVHCPLSEQTRGLIGAKELAQMKSTAYLINTARGGIVDEDALYESMRQQQIAGAALDCFAIEPVIGPSRFAEFDTVLLAPHSIAWTNEMFRDIGRMACRSMIDFAEGRTPRGVINPEVLERKSFQAKWARLTHST
jgi:phosphoglycerate dehydrogenase-like enzyme